MGSRRERRRAGPGALRRFIEGITRGRRRARARARTRSRPARIEGLEPRDLPAAGPVDVALVSVASADPKGVSVVYDVLGDGPGGPVDLGIYRSADGRLDAGDRRIGSAVIDASSPGRRSLDVPLPGGRTPDPSRPYVLAVADPDDGLREADEGNNTAALRTHLIGVVVHGGIQDSKSSPPRWELHMARTLRGLGYDVVIPYNWAAESRHPGAAARQGPRVANLVVKAAERFPDGEPADLHLIGHSEGAVVVSQALLTLRRIDEPPPLRAGYVTATLLDPHAANNNAPGGQYSVSSGLDGWIARRAIHDYQNRAKDPLVFVPDNVDRAEVYYQHTPVSWNGANGGTYNLWGQVPVLSQVPVSYRDITGPGTSHSGPTGVHIWYDLNILPATAEGDIPASPTRLTVDRVAAPGETTTARGVAVTPERRATYAGTAAPGAIVDLIAAPGGGPGHLLAGRAVADADGAWRLTSRPLPSGPYRMFVRGAVPTGPPRPNTHMFPTLPAGVLVVAPGSVRNRQ